MRLDVHWLWLAAAIMLEVAGTSLLQVAARGRSWWAVLGVAVSYGGAFWLLAQSLQSVPLGIAYALWSGLGTALIAAVGWLVFGQPLGVGAMAGIALIIAGAVLLHIDSAIH